MTSNQQILYDIEVHSVEGIKNYFTNGGDPNESINNVPLFTTMVEMYQRSPRFKECVKLFIDHGLNFDDEALLAVLADDAVKLESLISADKNIVNKRYSKHNNTFTSLSDTTLLHYCAEYNHVDCAKILISHGADTNARAGVDENGFGGHTPIFHTVAQNGNNSIDMLHLLAENGADLLLTLKGLIWGKGYEWETFIPSISPISYAMMGLLPQMHRNPLQIADNISLLLNFAYKMEYKLPNIPNKYLKSQTH
ncbi:MAG: ankyrin repeat domain-containing protein [Chitinophagaceae bacterium]